MDACEAHGRHKVRLVHYYDVRQLYLLPSGVAQARKARRRVSIHDRDDRVQPHIRHVRRDVMYERCRLRNPGGLEHYPVRLHILQQLGYRAIELA